MEESSEIFYPWRARWRVEEEVPKRGVRIKREVEQWKRKVSQLCSWRKDLPGVIIAQEEVSPQKSPLFSDHEPRPLSGKGIRKQEVKNQLMLPKSILNSNFKNSNCFMSEASAPTPLSSPPAPLPLLLKVKTVKERQKTEKQPTVRPARTVLCTDNWKPRWHPPSKKMLHERTHDKRARQQRSRGTCGAEGRGAWHSAPALNWWEEEDGDDGKTDALPSALGENNSTLRTTRATRVPKCVFPAL